MTYNLTGIQNADTLGELFVSVNSDLTGGILFSGLILVVYVIIVIMLVGRDTPFEKAMLVASFICLVPTILFTSVGFIGMTLSYIMITLMFLAALISWIIDRYF